MKEELKFTLRIDKELHSKILRIAEKNKRSLNSELLCIIEDYVKKEEKKDSEESKNK